MSHLPASGLLAYTEWSATAVGQFAGSPALDLVYTATVGPALGLLVGDGAGHFTASQIDLGSLAGDRIWTIAAGDFNEDGVLDLAVAAQNPPGQPATFKRIFVVLLLGDGAGGFRRSGILSDPNDIVSTLIPADFDGDGRPDLLVSVSEFLQSAPAPFLSLLLQRDLGGPEAGQRFYTVAPCRIFDSRSDPLGRLVSGAERLLRVGGSCGVPPSARAVSVTLTVVAPSALGYLAVYPGNEGAPFASALNFGAGQTRTSNAILRLATDGSGSVRALPAVVGKGDLDWVVDVSGYFE